MPDERDSLIVKDLKRVKKLVKKGWWLGLVLGLACHFVPPEYQVACKAIVDACTP
jgi:hypothetical protein